MPPCHPGYFSTTARIPDALSDKELALRRIRSPETLEIIGKLVRNVATQPNEDKYRSIRTTNPKITAIIIEQEGGLPALLALGFAPAADDADVLVVPKGVLTMKDVRLVEDTKDWLKKELRAMSRSSSKSSLSKEADADPAKAALRAQLEVCCANILCIAKTSTKADRKERAAQGPVTEGSKAQPLPGSGANVMTARTAGVAGNE